LNKIKVLITSRDYGAALNTLEVVNFLLADTRFELNIVTSEPAYSYFKKNLIQTNLVLLDINSKFYIKELMQEAYMYIKKYEPDIILTGLSGFNAGIDEAILSVAKGIPTFTLQDFWGYINHSLSSYADKYLVIDAYAKEITEEKHGQNAVITGGLAKYRRYNDIVSFNENVKDKNIVFFGQPLWQYKGYEKTLQFISEIFHQHKIPLIHYKTHPSEDKKYLVKLKEIFSYSTKLVVHSDLESVETVLFNTSLAISINSTVAIDLAYLMKYKKRKIALGVFLLIDNELKEFFYKDFKEKIHPMSLNGIVKEIQEKDEFSKLIKEFLMDNNQGTLDDIFYNVSNNLEYSSNVLENIKSELLNSYRS
jgi:hypothetical protein